jgi:hypothetical protein
MSSRCSAAFLTAALAVLAGTGAEAGNSPWSATVYAGPSSTAFVTQILDGKFDVNGGMVGLAVDRGLFKLGSGISIAAEMQVTDFFGKYSYQTGAFGIGLRFDEFPWSSTVPMSIAFYTGPSYAPDAPIILDPKPHPDPKFLNFVSLEVMFQMNRDWDVGLRAYHRSGAWGLYSNTADVGSMIGIGIRRRF